MIGLSSLGLLTFSIDSFIEWIHLEGISAEFCVTAKHKSYVEWIHELLQVNGTFRRQERAGGGSSLVAAQPEEQAGFRSQVKWNPQMHLEPAIDFPCPSMSEIQWLAPD